MRQGYYPLGESSIHYAIGGSGSTLLLCFHGYGESGATFDFLENALGEDYTILAIDLPFHGATIWKNGLFFDPADLLLLLDGIVKELPGVSGKWSLLGYSMGGRVALQLLEMAPEKIGKLILLAPDGFQVNPWYWLATQTSAGNHLFRFTMAHPSWFFFLLRAGNVLKWVNPGIYKFTMRYIDDVKVRRELYTRWTTMRGFRPDLAVIKQIIRRQAISVRLVYGRYDRIILPKRGERFLKGLEAQGSLLMLSSGHQLLQAASQEQVVIAITS